MMRKALLLGTVIAIIASIVLVARFGKGLIDPFDSRRFDPQDWAGADCEGRAAMARDAIRHVPPGFPEAEIASLLGKCDPVATDKLTNSAPPGAIKTYSYFLGNWSLFAYDSTFLWVHVDGTGKVVVAVIGGG